MTQDEIIRMARECLIYPSTITDDNGTGMYATFEVYKANIEALQRFAALVAAHEKKFWMEQIDVECNEAVLAEREACADLMFNLDLCGEEGKAAAAIRARGELRGEENV